MKIDVPSAFQVLPAATCLALLCLSAGAFAQTSGETRWASANDPVAAQLVEHERRWATLSCVSNNLRPAAEAALIGEFIAPDFVGTSPKGTLYTRSDMLPKPAPATVAEPERDCKLLSAKVRFIGANNAVIYGRESAMVKGADGKYRQRTLVWTDSVLRRAGTWQLIAVQDMVVPSK